MALDLVCGMEVKGERFCSTYESEKYCFCSQMCKEEFDRDPVAYVHGKGLAKLLTKLYPIK